MAYGVWFGKRIEFSPVPSYKPSAISHTLLAFRGVVPAPQGSDGAQSIF